MRLYSLGNIKSGAKKGVSRVYNFQINHSNSVANLGIKITPQIRNRIANSDRQVIKVSYGRAANLNDVERGLKLAIDLGYTKTDDPVVAKVKRFTALVRNGDLSVIESAETVGVDLAVISSLAEMALEQFSFVKQDGSSFSLTTEPSLDSSEKNSADEKGLIEKDLPKKTDRLPLRHEGDRGNKIQLKFPSVSSPTTKKDVNGSLEESQATESSDAVILDSNKKLPVEQQSNDSAGTISKSSAGYTLIDPNEDLSIYLTKVPSVPSLAKKTGSKDDERVENALKAHDLYFGWQRVVRQGILNIDDETENKVNRAISLVRRGTPIKTALKDARVGIQVSSVLLAISTDDIEALAYLSANVARAVW